MPPTPPAVHLSLDLLALVRGFATDRACITARRERELREIERRLDGAGI